MDETKLLWNEHEILKGNHDIFSKSIINPKAHSGATLWIKMNFTTNRFHVTGGCNYVNIVQFKWLHNCFVISAKFCTVSTKTSDIKPWKLFSSFPDAFALYLIGDSLVTNGDTNH